MTERNLLGTPADAMLGVVVRHLVDHICVLSGDAAGYRTAFRKWVADQIEALPMPDGMADPEGFRTAALAAFGRFMDA